MSVTDLDSDTYHQKSKSAWSVYEFEKCKKIHEEYQAGPRCPLQSSRHTILKPQLNKQRIATAHSYLCGIDAREKRHGLIQGHPARLA